MNANEQIKKQISGATELQLAKKISETKIPESRAQAPWPFFSEEEIAAVVAVLQSGKVNYWTGEQCRQFEQEYAQTVGCQYAIAVMNGTVALEAALYALDIGPGDEVITSCRTFIASASCIVMRGAKPVLADIDLESQNMTTASIEAVITPRTKAIIVVHLAGWPCAMDAILTLAKKYGLSVIEDCAQAHGAMYKNRQVGSWGDIAAFSFCQDKIITTGGEGGMITTNRKDLYEKMWSFKDHGKSFDAVYHRQHPPGFRWLHESFGSNYRMTEMQAVIGRIQLAKLANWIQMRQRHANIYHEIFSSLSLLRTTVPPEYIYHAYYKYYVFVRMELLKPEWSRDRIMQEIVAQGVPCQVGSCSEIYLEQAFVRAGLQPTLRFKNAKKLGESSLLFLVHPTLTEQNVYDMATIAAQIITEATLPAAKIVA